MDVDDSRMELDGIFTLVFPRQQKSQGANLCLACTATDSNVKRKGRGFRATGAEAAGWAQYLFFQATDARMFNEKGSQSEVI